MTPTLDQAIAYLAIDWHTIQVSPTKKARAYREASFNGALMFVSATFNVLPATLVTAASKRHDEDQRVWEEGA